MFKIKRIVAIVLLLVVVGLGTVPAFAADGPSEMPGLAVVGPSEMPGLTGPSETPGIFDAIFIFVVSNLIP